MVAIDFGAKSLLRIYEVTWGLGDEPIEGFGITWEPLEGSEVGGALLREKSLGVRRSVTWRSSGIVECSRARSAREKTL